MPAVHPDVSQRRFPQNGCCIRIECWLASDKDTNYCLFRFIQFSFMQQQTDDTWKILIDHVFGALDDLKGLTRIPTSVPAEKAALYPAALFCIVLYGCRGGHTMPLPNVKVKQEPLPGVLSKEISPFSRSVYRLTMLSPSPVPGISDVLEALKKLPKIPCRSS